MVLSVHNQEAKSEEQTKSELAARLKKHKERERQVRDARQNCAEQRSPKPDVAIRRLRLGQTVSRRVYRLKESGTFRLTTDVVEFEFLGITRATTHCGGAVYAATFSHSLGNAQFGLPYTLEFAFGEAHPIMIGDGSRCTRWYFPRPASRDRNVVCLGPGVEEFELT